MAAHSSALRIHNSLSGQKETFRPIAPGRAGMYVCGVTVYDYCHVGHARCYVAFDVIRRWLRYRGHQVTYVRNITDIDDKIIRRAAERGESIDALTGRFIAAMHEDFAALGIEPPDHEPRATDHIPEIIALIGRLVEREFAYRADTGDVLYSVARFPGYGALSGKRLGDLRAGARVDIEESKRDPLDFVLWKAAKPGEPAWDSPWGAGRPGWHIECSAMAMALLGVHFDLHGGGMDLKFPHHENEIAQSCAACDTRYVNLWMHNGFLNIDNEKMSKSLDNFFTVRDVLPRLRHPEVLRAFLLGSHYRGPINFSDSALQQADASLTRLYTALRGLGAVAEGRSSDHSARFEAAMDDDFNTPEALAALQGVARELNVARAANELERAQALGGELLQLAGLIGLLQVPVEQWFRLGAPEQDASERLDEARIESLIEARLTARRERDFVQADLIRAQLAEAGVVLEDQPGGRTLWKRG
jgi:cysteinyl-tRNA synthetase